ncbi:hypothetical protein KFJ24_08035 [Marinobacter sediminum]|uniref:hypothetical protein n=1 Tax=Marinobacter sediminum TaxID=256323 RepID=UPI002030F556|nr:hypothetical protein [Marinobacter sediminum]MCM0612422.1 hypothetical protein [Marinobacter sediminum]
MSDSENRSGGNRWWEFYFVRYFVGTVVGGAIILFLNASETSSLQNLIIPGVTDVSKLDVQHLFLLAAMGLAYCYISSAPILVLHASRGAFLTHNTKVFNRVFYGALFVVGVVAVAFYFLCSKLNMPVFMATVLFALLMSLQIVPFGFSLLKNGERAHTYYRQLTKARSGDTEEARQYIESYKHLREHGNAFFILLFELALGIILVAAPKPSIAFNVLLFWIIPAALVWLIGTVLEARFSNEPPQP